MVKEEYNKLLGFLDEMESIINVIKSRIKNCDNTDIILDSERVGIIYEEIKNDIKTKDLSNYEKDNLLRKHSDLTTYFADVQREWDTGCKCIKTSKEEAERKRKNKIKQIFERRTPEEMKLMMRQAKERIIEESIRERGR